jgi:hypothetical protein
MQDNRTNFILKKEFLIVVKALSPHKSIVLVNFS